MLCKVSGAISWHNGLIKGVKIDHLHKYGPGTRFGASPAGTDCDVCVSHLSFRFSSALELFWRYTTPPFLKYSFRRVMLQLEFQESKCKRERRVTETHRRCTCSVHARWRSDLQTLTVQETRLFCSSTVASLLFLKYFFRRAMLQLEFGWSKPDEWHSEQSEMETRKTAFCSSETLKSYYAGDWPTVTGCPVSNPGKQKLCKWSIAAVASWEKFWAMILLNLPLNFNKKLEKLQHFHWKSSKRPE